MYFQRKMTKMCSREWQIFSSKAKWEPSSYTLLQKLVICLHIHEFLMLNVWVSLYPQCFIIMNIMTSIDNLIYMFRDGGKIYVVWKECSRNSNYPSTIGYSWFPKGTLEAPIITYVIDISFLWRYKSQIFN